jgi:hypothetical protein
MEKLKIKFNQIIQTIKTWSLVEWIVNFRYFGYGVITTNLLMVGIQESIPNLVMFGGIVLLIEKQVRKK